MRKFVAIAAIAASAAATAVLSPIAAHAAAPFTGPVTGEVRTGCNNGETGYAIAPDGSVNPFALVAGTEYDVKYITGGAGVWQFFINQPNALESYGPGGDADGSFEHAIQRVSRAIVNLDGGRQMVFFNDKANSFSFNVAPVFTGAPPTTQGESFHVYYQCDKGLA